MGRVIAVAVVVVVLAAVGTGIWWFTGRDKASAEPTSGATTATVAASLTTMQKSVSATGTLTPTVQQAVSFAVSGTVTAVDVKEGDTVKVGQALATVDTLQLNADLLSAKADLASAQATLADLQASDDGSTTAASQIAAASAHVDVEQAAVTAATTALGEATLTAPVAGLITSVDLEVGQKVTGTGTSSSSSSSSSASGGTGGTGSSGTGSPSGSGSSSTSSSSSSSGQFEIVGTDKYEVSLSVDDADVALIKPGNQVEMTSDDLTGTVFGVVRTVGPLSTSTGVAAYPVMVDVTGDVSSLHDGISVTASIIYERRTDVLTIPTAAISRGTDGTSTVTKVASDGSTSKVTVTTGDTSGTLTEITQGLSEGDQVQVTTYARTGGTGSTSNNDREGGTGTFPGGGEFPGGGTGNFPGFEGGGAGSGQAPAQLGYRNSGTGTRG